MRYEFTLGPEYLGKLMNGDDVLEYVDEDTYQLRHSHKCNPIDDENNIVGYSLNPMADNEDIVYINECLLSYLCHGSAGYVTDEEIAICNDWLSKNEIITDYSVDWFRQCAITGEWADCVPVLVRAL
jgi:hypothetical protein